MGLFNKLFRTSKEIHEKKDMEDDINNKIKCLKCRHWLIRMLGIVGNVEIKCILIVKKKLK